MIQRPSLIRHVQTHYCQCSHHQAVHTADGCTAIVLAGNGQNEKCSCTTFVARKDAHAVRR